MSKTINNVQIKKNMIISVLAQIISLVVSFIMNLILPKYISEYQYAYWQTYLLYIGYVGVLHFGLLDGIVLRYSQYDYEELDKPRIRSQFKILLLITSFFCFLGIFLAGIYTKSDIRLVLIFTVIGIISRNIFTYTSYSFQITNRITKYATMIIAYRIFYGISVTILILCGVKNFYWFCLADLCSDFFGIIIGAKNNKGLYFGKSLSLRDAYEELKLNTSSGIMLMLANWSSFLLTGSARLIIQLHWDELTFGKVSFSFSITNLFLTFVSAISVVLFPSLKRTNPEKLPGLYKQIRDSISPFLVIILILYYPGCFLLKLWLPAYNASLQYLGILLPIIIFTSKVSLLTNNYLKAFRAEKKLLMINLLSVVLAILLFVLTAYVLNNMIILVICIVIVLAFRSILSEIAVMRILNIRGYSDFIIEILMTILFIISTTIAKSIIGFFIYTIALFGYVIFYRKTISYVFNSLLIRIKGKKEDIN